MQIVKEQYIFYENLLSYKTIIEIENIFEVIGYILKNIDKIGVQKINKMIFCMYGGIYSGKKNEIEFLIPVDNTLTDNDYFSFKPIFKMINAVKIRHEGLPKDLHISYDLLIDYIKKNGYKPITSAYCMVVRCDNEIPSNGIIDIYIGLNSNIL